MIKSFAATTRELDDIDAAVHEILTALDVEHNLLKNSMGVISFFPEFEDTGVLKAICEALPFDCIGATTNLSSADKQTDQLILGITVLTSDDCSFKAVSIPITADYKQTVHAELGAFLAQHDEKPALLLSYFPLLHEVSGDMILTAIDDVTGGIPLFGTTCIDQTLDYAYAKTALNGQAFRDCAVLGAIYGNPEFSFETASLDESKIRSQKAIITESSGNILIGINGKTALEYLEEIGLTKTEVATGMGVIPLVIDHKDGTKPIARVVFALTPDEHVVCGGEMPVNTTLGLGRIDRNDVLSTTETTLKKLVRDDSVILSYSCLARNLVLGAHNTAEVEKMIELVGDTNYIFACSGGEICPLPDANGELKNYYHNFTAVFCRLS